MAGKLALGLCATADANILANSAYYKAFRGKVIMSTSDMIILESCGYIGNTT